jgi:hypothetical protein
MGTALLDHCPQSDHEEQALMSVSGAHRPITMDQLALIVPHVPVPTRSCSQLLTVEDSE